MHKLRMMGISPMDDSLQSEHLAWPENKAVVITGQQWERGNNKPRVGGNRITPTSSLTAQGWAGSYPHQVTWQLLPPSAVCGKRWQKRPVAVKPGCQEEEGRQKANVACGCGTAGGRGHKEPGHLPTKLCAHAGDSDQQKGVCSFPVPDPRCWEPGRHDPERRLRARGHDQICCSGGRNMVP